MCIRDRKSSVRFKSRFFDEKKSIDLNRDWNQWFKSHWFKSANPGWKRVEEEEKYKLKRPSSRHAGGRWRWLGRWFLLSRCRERWTLNGRRTKHLLPVLVLQHQHQPTSTTQELRQQKIPKIHTWSIRLTKKKGRISRIPGLLYGFFLCFSFFLVFSYRFPFRFSFSVSGLLSLP